MIGVQLAQQLREAGLTWKPALGDRFAIPDHDLDDEVFVLSNMTIEVHTLPEGQVIGFNGTTEWALDDVEMDETVWLPREDQLRELLGGTFRALRRGPAGYEVLIDLLGEERTFAAETVEGAYAGALLHLLAAAGAA
ncbi:pilus assembly protein CpaE [Paractinoplanes lichenicola]|uniref:Pilus assembly protein CpaE n=1 Tax=Paractinoplanes lichenicola TaxID=2802976 RepID=A0ABS1VLE1_9ACTN|nr:pilus assembly protein CpaE [Actinoplanes lichenicola]MBL7254954.1 pilus assembly protein CpaE [Actinoplanes lichenicola]